MLKGKRILITQPAIRGFNGSTLVTLELADELQQQGASVTVYTCDFAEPAKSYYAKKHIKVDVAHDHPNYKLSDFDYIWVHSQIIPISILKKLEKKLPSKLPQFIFLHMSGMDWIPDEKPWIYNLENSLSSLSLFISEEVKDVNAPLLDKNIPTSFFRNPVPQKYQHRKTQPHNELKSLLIVTNHISKEVIEAKQILIDKYQIKVDSLGEDQDQYTLFDKAILEKYDAILTIAKTVPYCLVSGTPVYIYDIYGGGPGWLNKANLQNAKKRNFSGYQNSMYPNYEGDGFHFKNANQIAAEIIDGYHDSLKFHQQNQGSFQKDYLLDAVIPEIFSQIKPKKVNSFSHDYIESVIAAEQFATVRFETNGLLYERDSRIHNLNKELYECNDKLAIANNRLNSIQTIFDSRSYKLFDRLIKPYKIIRGRRKND